MLPTRQQAAPPATAAVTPAEQSAEHATPVVTSSDGTFALDLPEPRSMSYQISLTAEGRASRQGEAWHDHIALRAGGTFDLGDLVVPRAAPIRGRLVDRTGQTVRLASGQILARAPNARVDRWPPGLNHGSAQVRDSDTFATEPLAAGPWRLALHAKGWFAKPVTMMHEASGSELALVVEEVSPLRGLVVDEQDRVLPGIRISVDARQLPVMNTLHATTGADGRFTLPSDGFHGMDTPVTIIAYDQARRFGRTTREARFGGPELRLVLSRMRSLRVQVVDAGTGAPLPGAMIGWNADASQAFVAQSMPAPLGTAELVGLPDGPITVSAIGPTGQHRIARLAAIGVIRDADATEPDLVLRLQQAPTFAVRVVDGTTGVAGVKVELLDPIGRELSLGTAARVGVASTLFLTPDTVLSLGAGTTDSAGLVHVSLLGERTPLAIRLSGEAITTTIVRAPFGHGSGSTDDPIVCALAKGGAVAVHVSGTEGLVHLLLIRGAGTAREVYPPPARGVAPDAGKVAAFANVPAGVWRVHAQRVGNAMAMRPDQGPALATVTVVAGETSRVEVDVRSFLPGRLVTTLAPADDRPLTLGLRFSV